MLRNYIGNGAWEFVSSKTIPVHNEYLSSLKITLHLRRYSLFFVVNVFIPILTLSMLNIVAIFIPPESGEKLSYCIMLLLALAVYLSTVSDYLPKHSNKIASLCFFLLLTTMMSAFICACAVLSLNLYHWNAANSPPQWLRGLVYYLSCRYVLYKVRRPNPLCNGGRRDIGPDEETPSLKSNAYYNVTWKDAGRFVDHVCFFVSLV